MEAFTEETEAFTEETLSISPTLAEDEALVQASADRRKERGESSVGAMGSCLPDQCELKGVRVRRQYVLRSCSLVSAILKVSIMLV